MTPAEERALVDAAAAGVDAEVRDAYRELVDLIRNGAAPRDAVQQVMESFQGQYAAIMAEALSAIVGQSVGAASIVALEVGGVALSRHLYSQAQTVSAEVQGLVERHVAGFQDARTLALRLFEGYGFRQPGEEPLQFNRRNDTLPRYMREALLTDDDLAGQLQRMMARLQVDNLSTDALRAAYADVLRALDALEDGAGRKVLDKRIEVAFYERMRYFSVRIARTELHRAYAEREARLLLDDDDVEYVQIRRAPGGEACICSLFAGRDLYGLGPGVYPKRNAPLPPFHPHCRCVTSPRLDLTGRKAGERDPEGDRYFLRSLDGPLAARVVGSRGKLDAVLKGQSPESIVNSGRDPLYHVRTVGMVAL